MTVYTSVLLASFAVALCGQVCMATSSGTAATDPSDTFKSAYANAKDPDTRRTLVIEAIDSGLIKTGMSFKDLQQLFATALQDLGGNANNGRRSAVVFFSPVIPPRRPLESGIRSGWYIDFIFSKEDMLTYYSLSNLHKYTR